MNEVSSNIKTQNDLLLKNLLDFFKNETHLRTFYNIISGLSPISLRIIDWFITNYSKHYFVVYDLHRTNGNSIRYKVYQTYKLKLKAYGKKRFDPFCRWDRISIPFLDGKYIETTLGQLNFFKCAIEDKILDYINEHFKTIEEDMNSRNTTSRKKDLTAIENSVNKKTRKKREELSVSAAKSIKKEDIEIVVSFK